MKKIEADNIVKNALENNVADLDLRPDDMDYTLRDIGVDSLDVMMIMMDVQEKSGVEIPDDLVVNLDTPEKIANFILDPTSIPN